VPTTGPDDAFQSTLVKFPGKGGWWFVAVPPDRAPAVTRGWGRTPVFATVDGLSWETSVWRGKNGVTLLAIPKSVRRTKTQGDRMTVSIVAVEDPD
jgi:hypothetical protein